MMTTSQNSPHHGRRKFLVKGSSLALITSLPLKSTWAAGECNGTVSGNLSGNTSSPACNIAIDGISPDDWIINGNASSAELATRWSDVFLLGFKGTYSSPTGLPGNVIADPTLKNILDRLLNVVVVYDSYLVAGYLNALKGHYPLATGVTAIDYARILEEEAQVRETDVLNALEKTWT